LFINFILFLNLDCALGCRSWIGTLVAVRLLSDLFLVDPMARDRSLGMARHSGRSWSMAEWSKDHVAAIGSLNSTLV
jgi:hypothetical protein